MAAPKFQRLMPVCFEVTRGILGLHIHQNFDSLGPDEIRNWDPNHQFVF